MMNYNNWIKSVPTEITKDALWSVEAYRLSLFASDFGWFDVTKLMNDKRTRNLSDQLYRSVGSISANIAERYSHGSRKDQARFYEYALGSERESRDWYYKGRHILGTEIVSHRIRFLTQVIQLLLKMIPQQRSYKVCEPEVEYISNLEELLIKIPLP
jgi:four helix bundle protein